MPTLDESRGEYVYEYVGGKYRSRSSVILRALVFARIGASDSCFFMLAIGVLRPSIGMRLRMIY